MIATSKRQLLDRIAEQNDEILELEKSLIKALRDVERLNDEVDILKEVAHEGWSMLDDREQFRHLEYWMLVDWFPNNEYVDPDDVG